MSTKRELFDHQKIAADFLAGKPGHLLAGEMGTGKTFSSIVAAEKRGAKNILVTAPVVALTNWQREFALAGSSLITVDAKRHPKKVKDANVVILSVDSVRSSEMQEMLQSRAWDVHIADEAHRFCNPESGRTQAIYSDKVRVGKPVFLTGTPTPKHAGNLWPHINRSAPERIDNMTYEQFTNRFCITEMKKLGSMRFAQPIITGNNPATIAELRNRLAGWWLRQRKADVMAYLPPKIYNRVELPAARADIRAIEAEMDPELFEALEFAMETGDTRMLDMMASETASLRRLLAMTKVGVTVDYIKNLMEDGVGCLSVWGWHTEALRRMETALTEAGYAVARIDGSTSQSERQRIVDAFQEGKLDIVVGQIIAAGIAITLTRASRAVFLEKSFLPSDNEQAEDRHHRIGQKDSVQIDNIVLTGTIDEAVDAIVQKRQEQYETLSKKAIQV